MRKQYLVTALTAVALLLGLGVTLWVSPQATPSASATHTIESKMKPDGTWDTFQDGIKLVSAQSGLNPLVQHKFDYRNQKNLCLADYTPEITSWDPQASSLRWNAGYGSLTSPIKMYYDDMNGDVGVCGNYPASQKINLYSYGDANDGYCATSRVVVSGVDDLTILQATAWLNRLADNAQCRQTFTLRQNTVSAIIGNVLGLGYHVNGNVSVMCQWLTYRLDTAYSQYSDFEALNRRY